MALSTGSTRPRQSESSARTKPRRAPADLRDHLAPRRRQDEVRARWIQVDSFPSLRENVDGAPMTSPFVGDRVKVLFGALAPKVMSVGETSRLINERSIRVEIGPNLAANTLANLD